MKNLGDNLAQIKFGEKSVITSLEPGDIIFALLRLVFFYSGDKK